MITRRCGGGFGSKLSRANLAACASALVCNKLKRPCRMAMNLPSIMRAMGKRCNSRLDYEVVYLYLITEYNQLIKIVLKLMYDFD